MYGEHTFFNKKASTSYFYFLVLNLNISIWKDERDSYKSMYLCNANKKNSVLNWVSTTMWNQKVNTLTTCLFEIHSETVVSSRTARLYTSLGCLPGLPAVRSRPTCCRGWYPTTSSRRNLAEVEGLVPTKPFARIWYQGICNRRGAGFGRY